MFLLKGLILAYSFQEIAIAFYSASYTRPVSEPLSCAPLRHHSQALDASLQSPFVCVIAPRPWTFLTEDIWLLRCSVGVSAGEAARVHGPGESVITQHHG